MRLVTAGLFTGSSVLQVAAVLLLPLSNGFTKPVPTVGCLASFAVALWILAFLIKSGANLSVLVPLNAALVPIVTIGAAMILFHEPSSVARVGLLLVACVLIGVAGWLR